MSDGSLPLTQLLERRERDYLLEKVNVLMRSSVENLDIGGSRVENLKVGESAELPRWVAEELVNLNVARIDEEPFDSEVFRALSREKMMGPLQLSVLEQDFYLRLKRRLAQLAEGLSEGKVRKEDFDRIKAGTYDLIGMRLSKLLSLSSSTTSSQTLIEKLTPEETAFFSVSQSLSKEWRLALLGSSR